MQYIDLGLVSCRDSYNFQLELVKKVSEGLSENTLIVAEHFPVITIGRRGSRDNILNSEEFLIKRGIRILNIDRGGDVTYHGPGQLVAYPIFKLENEAADIHGFLRFLEEIGINFLNKYGVTADRNPGFTGIWADGEKIGSIGIGVKKWVTYHGLAININIDLAPFLFIKPCGIKGVKMTSLEKILNRKIDFNDAKNKIRQSFEEVPLLAEAVCKDR